MATRAPPTRSTRPAAGWISGASSTTSPPRRSGFRRRGCLRVLRTGSPSGGETSHVVVKSQLPTSNSQGTPNCHARSTTSKRTHRIRFGSWRLEMPWWLEIGSWKFACSFAAARGSLFAPAQLGSERILSRPRSENPADDDSDQQHTGNEDEVRRGHVAHGNVLL